jgi:hypothetical protein
MISATSAVRSAIRHDQRSAMIGCVMNHACTYSTIGSGDWICDKQGEGGMGHGQISVDLVRPVIGHDQRQQ